MSASVKAILDNLQTQEAALKDRYSQIDAERKEIQVQLKQIKKAVRALAGETETGKQQSANKQSAPTREEISSAICRVLAAKGVCHEEVLVEATEGMMASQGKSCVDFQVKLKEALEDERFVQVRDGYRLREASPAAKQDEE